MSDIEFVPLSTEGRRFSEDFMVRLGDADARGKLRLDGVARFLQDVATDDSSETRIADDATWVVRRTALRSIPGTVWPQYLDRLTLTTWCGGVGPAWAERRTNIELNGQLVLETAAIWVPVDRAGHPMRIRENFFAVYGDAARGRKVSGRITVPEIPADARRRQWTLRESDFDVVGHVNNAALWTAVSEVTRPPLAFVNVLHHASIERGEDVELVEAPGFAWLCVGGEVRVSARYENL